MRPKYYGSNHMAKANRACAVVMVGTSTNFHDSGCKLETISTTVAHFGTRHARFPQRVHFRGVSSDPLLPTKHEVKDLKVEDLGCKNVRCL